MVRSIYRAPQLNVPVETIQEPTQRLDVRLLFFEADLRIQKAQRASTRSILGPRDVIGQNDVS